MHQSLLSGEYQHATLPAVAFGQEAQADSMTDAVLVVRFSLLEGKTFADAVDVLGEGARMTELFIYFASYVLMFCIYMHGLFNVATDATTIEMTPVEEFATPSRRSLVVQDALIDSVTGKVKGKEMVVKVLPLPPLLQGVTSCASGMSVLGKSPSPNGGRATVKTHGKQLANGGRATVKTHGKQMANGPRAAGKVSGKKPKKPADNRKRAKGVKRARQRPESDKDGICSTCGKHGKKASAGDRRVKPHMKHCGMRDKAGDACSGCGEEGKSLQHTKLCGYYR